MTMACENVLKYNSRRRFPARSGLGAHFQFGLGAKLPVWFQPRRSFLYIGINLIYSLLHLRFAATHKAEYHSGGHGFIYQGSLVRVHRRNDGKIPCPCGREDHARYSFKKLTAINRQDPHPISEASEWADHLPDVKPSQTSSLSQYPPNPTDPSPEANAEISEQNGQNALQDLQSSHSPIAYTPQPPPQFPSPSEAFPPSPNPAPAMPPTLHIDNLTTSALSEGLTGDSGHMKDLNEEMEIGIEVEGVQDIVPAGDTAEFDEGGNSTDDEQSSNEGDDSSDDEDQQGRNEEMVVDHAPSYLSPPEIISSLSRFNIIVEPVYHLSICTECAIPVRLEHMYTHQKTKHFKGLVLPPELTFPSRAELESLLATLGADQPLEVPVGPIPRIRGVQIIQGLKCMTSGCSGGVFGAVEGRSRNLRVHQLQGGHPQPMLGGVTHTTQ
ncbi:hypothetical protein C8J55DRAFT_492652 [Lentinula edodes]|uniref:Uncharacterized protein n=1 Tax=Lentinula lateritia TaxID=40482 RepID=A0A9W8ZV62_9AGAR|nr:hypothetical protein C8J55DRAFT_492652 [Lentinula edodes]